MAFLVPFIPEHFARMDVKADAREAAKHPAMIPALERVGHTVLANDGYTVLGVIGAVPTVPGVCEVFILATETQARFPVSFARVIRKELFTLKDKYRRIQSVSKCDEFHYRWLSWLGFSAEGVLKRYGLNGEDMIMWGMA